MLEDTKNLLKAIEMAEKSLGGEFLPIIKSRLDHALPDQDREALTAKQSELEKQHLGFKPMGPLGGSAKRMP